MVNSRNFHDLNLWLDNGKFLAWDRDKSVVTEVRLLSPDRAIAVVDENWFIQLSDKVTRRQILMKKSNFISVRYFLKQIGGVWIVVEYEVYPQGEPVPPVPAERLVKW